MWWWCLLLASEEPVRTQSSSGCIEGLRAKSSAVACSTASLSIRPRGGASGPYGIVLVPMRMAYMDHVHIDWMAGDENFLRFIVYRDNKPYSQINLDIVFYMRLRFLNTRASGRWYRAAKIALGPQEFLPSPFPHNLRRGRKRIPEDSNTSHSSELVVRCSSPSRPFLSLSLSFSLSYGDRGLQYEALARERNR
jgi:hypothetical protein